MVGLILKTDITAADTLRIREITPVGNGGWGSPNPARSSVAKWHITLGYTNGKSHKWEVDGAAGADFSLGKWTITAAQMALYLSECAGLRELRSGCLRVKVEAMTRETVTRNYSDNFVTLTTTIPAGFLFQVNRDGEWIDATSEGAVTNGVFTWQKLNSLYLYTQWRVQKGNIVVDSGNVVRNQLSTTGTIQAGNLTVIGRGEVNVLIAIAERLEWSRRLLRDIQDSLKGCSPHIPAALFPAYAGQSNDCALAKIGSLLDILEGKNALVKPDCAMGEILLKRIKILLQ